MSGHHENTIEHHIYRDIANGNLTGAIVYANEAMPDIATEPVSVQLMWACVIAACKSNGANGLRYMADAFDVGQTNKIPPALDTLRRLAQAVKDDDAYTMKAMVDRIRAAAPNTNREKLADLLLLMMFEPSTSDPDRLGALFTATAEMMPILDEARTSH